VTPGATLADKRLLIVDDVLTTGATLAEIARTLKAAGARQVDVFALARVVQD
jgi:predicted amidophosphoribosyltransferase